MSSVTWNTNWQAADRPAPREIFLRVMGEVLFWGVMLQLVAGIYLQAQLALLQRVVIPNAAPKLLLVGLVVSLAAAALFLQRGQIRLRPSFLPAAVFACYLVADLAWLVISSEQPLGALLFGFNKYFLFFAAIPAAALLRPRISARQMNVRLMLLFVPSVAVAIAQFALNDPLLPTRALDNSFEIPAVEFFGRVRAFSLFRGVMEFGQGLAFFGALLIAQLLVGGRRGRWAIGLMLLLTTVACVATLRRGAYMECGAAAISAVAICGRWRTTTWLPWIYLAIAVGLSAVGPMVGSTRVEGMLSSTSLAERRGAWQSVLDHWMEHPDASMFLGTGMAQTSSLGTGLSHLDAEQVDYLLVDNGFLAVTVQLGLVGVVLWFWAMQALWRDMLGTAWNTGKPLAIGVAALLSTWMMRDVFDPLFALYPLYAFLVFWMGPEEERSARAEPARQEALCP
jgi:hypothetical protein